VRPTCTHQPHRNEQVGSLQSAYEEGSVLSVKPKWSGLPPRPELHLSRTERCGRVGTTNALCLRGSGFISWRGHYLLGLSEVFSVRTVPSCER
jgi:hypothetical protein